ncbi:hypothetical protein Tco_0597859 [Tanacetum coccineum]
MQVVQVVLWYLDSGCLKHMMGDRSWLRDFVKKFIGTVRFGNDHFGAIMGYGNYVIGDSVISMSKLEKVCLNCTSWTDGLSASELIHHWHYQEESVRFYTPRLAYDRKHVSKKTAVPEKDVTRSKEFIATIERRLKTRRIYRNLECFIGGRVRDIDYRLLQRME